MAHMVQRKGAKEDWAIQKVLLDIEDFGYAGAKIVVQSDQVPVMVDFQRKRMEGRKADIVPKNSQVGESQANGEAEDAIKRLQEQTHIIKDDLSHLINAMVNRRGQHCAEQVHNPQGWPQCLPQHKQVIQAAGCQPWRKVLYMPLETWTTKNR